MGWNGRWIVWRRSRSLRSPLAVTSPSTTGLQFAQHARQSSRRRPKIPWHPAAQPLDALRLAPRTALRWFGDGRFDLCSGVSLRRNRQFRKAWEGVGGAAGFCAHLWFVWRSFMRGVRVLRPAPLDRQPLPFCIACVSSMIGVPEDSRRGCKQCVWLSAFLHPSSCAVLPRSR